MKKLKVPKLVTIAILTLITIVFWIFFSVFRVFTSKPAPAIPQQVLEPLTPFFDKENLGKMEQRIFFEKGGLASP